MFYIFFEVTGLASRLGKTPMIIQWDEIQMKKVRHKNKITSKFMLSQEA